MTEGRGSFWSLCPAPLPRHFSPGHLQTWAEVCRARDPALEKRGAGFACSRTPLRGMLTAPLSIIHSLLQTSGAGRGPGPSQPAPCPALPGGPQECPPPALATVPFTRSGGAPFPQVPVLGGGQQVHQTHPRPHTPPHFRPRCSALEKGAPKVWPRCGPRCPQPAATPQGFPRPHLAAASRGDPRESGSGPLPELHGCGRCCR